MADAQGDLIRTALLVGLLAASAGAQQTPEPAVDDLGFASRLSEASAATEYWDVTAELQERGRLFLRFLITNEGPGSRTAAAAGHLILPNGDLVPIKFGRTSGSWQLGPDRRRLKIASAVLDLSGPDSKVEVDSNKYGIQIELRFKRPEKALSLPAVDGYGVEVLTPTATSGSVRVKEMKEPLAVEGTLGLTHTWMERQESEILQRRAELLAHPGSFGLYLLHLTLTDGSHRGLVVLDREGQPPLVRDDAVWELTQTLQPEESSGYPVAGEWKVRSGGIEVAVHLRGRPLRWDPLEVIPQPFRFLLGFRTQPQKTWTDAGVELSVSSAAGDEPCRASGDGVASVTFAQPEAPR